MDVPSITCVIVDDELSAITTLEKMLREHSWINISDTISDSKEAVNKILELKPDLVFLDIQMPEKTGFEIVSELFSNNFKPDFIFVTAFDKFAIEAIRHAAFDYLLKPVDPLELHKALMRYAIKFKTENHENNIQSLVENTILKHKIKLSTAGGFTLIDVEEILYIQADWNYAEIFLCNGKSELVTMNLGSLEKSLPQSHFYRISRSIILNLAYLSKVSRVKRMALLTKDGKEYSFKIPFLNIRKLEHFLSGSKSIN